MTSCCDTSDLSQKRRLDRSGGNYAVTVQRQIRPEAISNPLTVVSAAAEDEVRRSGPAQLGRRLRDLADPSSQLDELRVHLVEWPAKRILHRPAWIQHHTVL